MKAGHLRKHMDYLVSHRIRIPDAMSYNCLLTNQTKSKQAKYAGLLVCDNILKSVCERQVEANKELLSKSLKLINTSQNNSSMIEHNKSRTLKTESSEKEKEINVHIVGNSMGGEKSKLEECYFNTIQHFIKAD